MAITTIFLSILVSVQIRNVEQNLLTQFNSVPAQIEQTALLELRFLPSSQSIVCTFAFLFQSL